MIKEKELSPHLCLIFHITDSRGRTAGLVFISHTSINSKKKIDGYFYFLLDLLHWPRSTDILLSLCSTTAHGRPFPTMQSRTDHSLRISKCQTMFCFIIKCYGKSLLTILQSFKVPSFFSIFPKWSRI